MRRLIARFPLTATVAALTVWIVHFVLVYAAVGIACERPQTLGESALGAWLLLTTVAALAAVVLAAGVGYACTRPGEGAATTRRRFLGWIALLLAVLAFLAVVFVSAPMLLLPPCAGWRPA
jgi:hypothetical protein